MLYKKLYDESDWCQNARHFYRSSPTTSHEVPCQEMRIEEMVFPVEGRQLYELDIQRILLWTPWTSPIFYQLYGPSGLTPDGPPRGPCHGPVRDNTASACYTISTCSFSWTLSHHLYFKITLISSFCSTSAYSSTSPATHCYLIHLHQLYFSQHSLLVCCLPCVIQF